jgi:uncharacterized membrane protein
MYSKAKIAGHPIHPMLVSFPVAFYVATLGALITFQVTSNPFWFRMAIVTNAAGVIMAALAAVPGFIDYFTGIPKGTRAAATARTHALLNVSALVLFAVSLVFIGGGWTGPIENATAALALSLIGVLATVGAGWFGWKLVQHHHVGVEPLDGRDAVEAALEQGQKIRNVPTPPPMTGQPRPL